MLGIVQASAASMGELLRRDPLLRSTLIHLVLATALGLLAALVLDRWLLRQMRRLSEQASRFDPTLPPRVPTWLDDDEPRPRELLQLEQALEHDRTSLGDGLQRRRSGASSRRWSVATP